MITIIMIIMKIIMMMIIIIVICVYIYIYIYTHNSAACRSFSGPTKVSFRASMVLIASDSIV